MALLRMHFRHDMKCQGQSNSGSPVRGLIGGSPEKMGMDYGLDDTSSRTVKGRTLALDAKR